MIPNTGAGSNFIHPAEQNLTSLRTNWILLQDRGLGSKEDQGKPEAWRHLVLDTLNLDAQEFYEYILQFNHRAVEFWNRGDLERFCDGYSRDALYVSSGKLMRGRDVILDQYRESFPDRKTMGQLHLNVRDVRFLPHEDHEPVRMAIAVIEWLIEKEDGPSKGFSMVTYADAGEGIWVTQDLSA